MLEALQLIALQAREATVFDGVLQTSVLEFPAGLIT
jgi:hypothetical protein